MNEDTELQMLKWNIIIGWPHTKDEVKPGLERYWLIRHELTIIYSITIKG